MTLYDWGLMYDHRIYMFLSLCLVIRGLKTSVNERSKDNDPKRVSFDDKTLQVIGKLA